MRYWIWLTQLQHMGPITVNKLLEVFKTPDAVYQTDEASLREVEGINKKQIEKIVFFFGKIYFVVVFIKFFSFGIQFK